MLYIIVLFAAGLTMAAARSLPVTNGINPINFGNSRFLSTFRQFGRRSLTVGEQETQWTFHAWVPENEDEVLGQPVMFSTKRYNELHVLSIENDTEELSFITDMSKEQLETEKNNGKCNQAKFYLQTHPGTEYYHIRKCDGEYLFVKTDPEDENTNSFLFVKEAKDASSVTFE